MHALERVGSIDAGDDGVEALLCGGAEDAIDERVAGAWAGGVVDRDVRAGVGDEREGVGDGLVAMGLAAAAEACAQEREFVGVSRGKIGEGLVVGGPGDDDGGDVVALVEEFDGALQDRAASQVFVELGSDRSAERGRVVFLVASGGREERK